MDFRDIQNLSEAYLSIYEANRWEKHLGIHKNTPESEFARSQHRAFHTGTPVPTNAKKPSDIEPGTLRMNRGLARMASKRNRGKSPTDSTYTHRRKIDPLKIDSWRDSPLGYPSGYSNPLGGPVNISHKTKANVRPGRELLSNPLGASSNIRKFKREETEYLISHLLDEGYDLTDFSLDEIYDLYEKVVSGYNKFPQEKVNKQMDRHIDRAATFSNLEKAYRDTPEGQETPWGKGTVKGSPKMAKHAKDLYDRSLTGM